MQSTRSDVAALVNRLPDADSPGKTSKFTGPSPTDAASILNPILAGGRESLLQLIGMIRDPVGGGGKNYKPGYALHGIAVLVGRPGMEKQRAMFADALASKIGVATLSKDIQGFLIRELQVAGGADVTDVLAKQLQDDALCEYATQALLAIGEGAAEKLRAALPYARGGNKLTIVQALGVVRDAASVDALDKLTTDEDGALRMAATWALANIGAPDGADAVLRAAEKAPGWERTKAIQACLLLAETLLAAGKKLDARRIYRHVRETNQDAADAYLREAAERGLAATGN